MPLSRSRSIDEREQLRATTHRAEATTVDRSSAAAACSRTPSRVRASAAGHPRGCRRDRSLRSASTGKPTPRDDVPPRSPPCRGGAAMTREWRFSSTVRLRNTPCPPGTWRMPNAAISFGGVGHLAAVEMTVPRSASTTPEIALNNGVDFPAPLVPSKRRTCLRRLPCRRRTAPAPRCRTTPAGRGRGTSFALGALRPLRARPPTEPPSIARNVRRCRR